MARVVLFEKGRAPMQAGARGRSNDFDMRGRAARLVECSENTVRHLQCLKDSSLRARRRVRRWSAPHLLHRLFEYYDSW
eukprot:4331696-Pyramimonas_sp.AAC.1